MALILYAVPWYQSSPLNRLTGLPMNRAWSKLMQCLNVRSRWVSMMILKSVERNSCIGHNVLVRNPRENRCQRHGIDNFISSFPWPRRNRQFRAFVPIHDAIAPFFIAGWGPIHFVTGLKLLQDSVYCLLKAPLCGLIKRWCINLLIRSSCYSPQKAFWSANNGFIDLDSCLSWKKLTIIYFRNYCLVCVTNNAATRSDNRASYAPSARVIAANDVAIAAALLQVTLNGESIFSLSKWLLLFQILWGR
jgi:hypothetical protein